MSPHQPLDICLEELRRYYRHSSAGRRCGGIVHNMNTPLQVLSFNLELLENKARQESQLLAECPPDLAARWQPLLEYRRQKLEQFRQEVDRLQVLSRRVVQQGLHEDEQERQFLDLNQLYREELELYQAVPFFKHQVEKDIRLQADLPSIFGYYIDFSQSFRNLVDNALEAMESREPRKLTVETGMEQGQFVLRLGDTGSGVPPEISGRLFEPFVTSKNNSVKTRAGLGLFMSRQLLAPYGATLTVDSRPGETWVHLRLPLEKLKA